MDTIHITDAYLVDESQQSKAAAAAAAQVVYTMNEAGIRGHLNSLKWPVGLVDTFVRNVHTFPIRYFLVDDSGSMNTDDGCIYADKKKQSCSRWLETKQMLQFHTDISAVGNLHSNFRFLNQSQDRSWTVGDSDRDVDNCQATEFANVLKSMQGANGSTPLRHHISNITREIQLMSAELNSHNKKAAVVIITDGLSSDGDILPAMKELAALPVWIVIRLVTNEEHVIQYWNKIDEDLEFALDILDDIESEAKEIKKNNPWINYGLPLHQMREFGISIPEFDYVDNAPLTISQMKSFCHHLFGLTFSPNENVHVQINNIHIHNQRSPLVWNCLTGKNDLWIDIAKLKKSYIHKSFCTIM